MVICAIFGCSATYRKDDKSVNLYGLPSVITNQCDRTRELSTRRRATWLSRINRAELLKLKNTTDVKVCNKHFFTGKPAQLWEENNPDWAPTLLLGYSRKDIEQKFIERSSLRTQRTVERRKRIQESDSFQPAKRRVIGEERNVLPAEDTECRPRMSQTLDSDSSEDNLEEDSIGKIEVLLCEPNFKTNPSDVTNDVTTPKELQCEPDFDIEQLEVVLGNHDLETSSGDLSGNLNSETSLGCQTDLTCIDIHEIMSENETLRKEIAALKSDLLTCEGHIKERKDLLKSAGAERESLKLDNNNLRAEVISLRDKVKTLSLDEDSFKNNDSKVKFYTGLPTFSLLLHIFNFVGCKIEHTHRNALPKFSEFLVTMMRLRLGLFETDLAYRFGIAQSTVSFICDKWIRMMSARLSPFLIWPERDVLQKTMPQCFKDAFGLKIAVIIDCFEVFINKASSLKSRAETWSNYKHQNTIKFLVGITPQGTICFISKAWGGKASDKCITLNSGFLDKLCPGDVVLADRGFDIAEDLGWYRAKLEIPAFTKGKTQLSCDDVMGTRNIANVRIHVERVIGYTKRKYTILIRLMPYGYLSSRFPGDDAMVDHIVRVCAALINFCPPIVPLTEETDGEIE